MRDNVRAAFETMSWAGKGGKSPRSGPVSTLAWTKQLRQALPRVFDQYGVKTFLDAPCGDWFWMQHVDLSDLTYIGGDISKEVADANIAKFTRPGVSFLHLDITSDPLPAADMMLCRDCLMHLKLWLRWKFFENFAASDCKYLMTTVHHVLENQAVKANGGFKYFNPAAPPFNFDPALDLIPESADELSADILENSVAAPEHQSIGIWSKKQVIDALARRVAEPPQEPPDARI